MEGKAASDPTCQEDIHKGTWEISSIWFLGIKWQQGRTFYSGELSGLKMIFSVETLLAWSRCEFVEIDCSKNWTNLCLRMCLSWWVKLNTNRAPWILELQGSKWVEGMWNVSPNWENKSNSSSSSNSLIWYMIIIFCLFDWSLYMYSYNMLMPWGELCFLILNLQSDNDLEGRNNIIREWYFKGIYCDHRLLYEWWTWRVHTYRCLQYSSTICICSLFLIT